MSRSVWYVLIGAIVIVAAVFGLAYWTLTRTPAPQSPAPTSTTGLPAVTLAPTGTLAPSFNQQFILDPQAIVTQSYTQNYPGGLTQFTASLDSKDTVSDLYQKYAAYFLQNGWEQMSTETSTKSASIYESKANTDVTVTITDAGAERQISVDYLSQPSSTASQ